MTINIVTEHNRIIASSIYRAGKEIKHRCCMADADVWIDCPTCDLSIGASDSTGRTIPDEEFIKLVRNEGWAFIPNIHIACPDCRKKSKNKDGGK